MSWPIWLVGTCDHTCWGISSDMPSYPLQECVVPLSWFRWPLSRREPLGLIRPSCLLPWVPPQATEPPLASPHLRVRAGRPPLSFHCLLLPSLPGSVVSPLPRPLEICWTVAHTGPCHLLSPGAPSVPWRMTAKDLGCTQRLAHSQHPWKE